MKKILFFLLSVAAISMTTASCSDMIETESDRVLTNPSLNEKTDSMYYTLGILKSVQQLADQLVLANEMRGDMVTVNSHSSVDLRQLANFSADATNKYDSAYVFYRVINNCNYFIAHRDTTLMTGSEKVAIPEYVQALSIRAWTYLQLAKLYGSVPFFTHPILNISDAEAQSVQKDINGIADELLPQLLRYSGTNVPSYGTISAGNANDGTGGKDIVSSRIMFPVDLVIADLYLETDQYAQAAQHYFKYLKAQKMDATNGLTVSFYEYLNFEERAHMPHDFNTSGSNIWGDNIFKNSRTEVITEIPMAVNRMKGQVTNLPAIFGYDYYTTGIAKEKRYLRDRQISPSQEYYDLSNRQTIYYLAGKDNNQEIKSHSLGDTRHFYTWESQTDDIDSTFSTMHKIESANVYVYRTSTVYLRLAEALNRMGYPDAAFAILKDGMNLTLLTNAKYNPRNDNATYMRQETLDMLETTIPFLSQDNADIFKDYTEGENKTRYKGIHSHGCMVVYGQNSGYQYKSELMRKWLELKEKGVKNTAYDEVNAIAERNAQAILDAIAAAEAEGNTGPLDIELESDSTIIFGPEAIDAIEDLICDEYALELACEGTRFSDLTRIARHKNTSSPYGSNYGSVWFARKLEKNKPVVDLTDPRNWYLPLK